MRIQALIDKAESFFVRLRTTPVPISTVSARIIAEAWAAACVLSPERALLHFADPIARLAAINLHALGESLRHELEDPAGLNRPDLRIAVGAWTAVLLAELDPGSESHQSARLALVQYARTASPHRSHLGQRLHGLLMRRLGLWIPREVPVGFRVAACRYGCSWRGIRASWIPPVAADEMPFLRRLAKEAKAQEKDASIAAVPPAVAETPATTKQCWSLPDIVTALSTTVVGQESAIRAFACCCVRHQRGLGQGVLISGPTGSGKSLLARQWAELSGRPMVSLDCSTLVPEGIRGTSVGDGLLAIWRSAGRDLERTRGGIVFLDEFDKPSHYATEVRSSLLTLLDGAPWTAFDPEKIDRGHRLDAIPTRGLMIILAGSFTELRDDRESTMGFGTSAIRSDQVELDLETLIPLADLRGRITSHVEIVPLSRAALTRILASESGPLASLRSAFRSWEIRPSDALIDRLVAHALAAGLGARSLWPLVRRIEDDVLHDPPTLPGEYHGLLFGWPLRRLPMPLMSAAG